MAKKGNSHKFDKAAMDSGRVVLSPLILVFRVKKKYADGQTKEGIKNLDGALIAANHTGFSDPFILNASFWYRRFFYTASEEVMAGFKGKMLIKAGCIKVDRTITDLDAVKTCVRILKDGYLLGIFPQGHIGGEGAKGGAIMMAAMAKVPIIPVYIKKRKHWWQRQTVIYGAPMNIKELCGKALPGAADIEKLAELLMKRIEACGNCE